MVTIFQVQSEKLKLLTERSCSLGEEHQNHPQSPRLITMMDSDSAAGVLSADRSKPDSTPPEKQDDYMTYKARSNRNVESYDYYFDRLGFTDDCTKRDGLKTRISDYVVNAGVGCRFLRSDDNPKLFKELITGFLKKHGPTYWPSGCHDRSHLKEIDARKGFMCPRDAERSRSR